MAIADDLQKILDAHYGRDVRQSIHDSIKDIWGIADTAKDSATAAASEAKAAATTAVTAGQAAQSYAVGGTGTREGEDVDNAKYYCAQAKGAAGSIKPQGAVVFANLPTEGMAAGDMYTVSDAFVSDDRFAAGAGISYPAGTSIYWMDGKWSVLAALPDLSEYQTKTGDTASNVVTFKEATKTADLKSGESHSVLFGKISKSLKVLSETLSSLASKLSTDEGAISTLQSELSTATGDISALSSQFTNYSRRTRKDITSSLSNLSKAVAEQNLEKYGYSIGDYFTGTSGYVYTLADMDTYYGGYDSYAVVSKHHVGIVVDTKATSAWLSSGSAGSYSASTLHSYLKNTALPKIKSDFVALFGSSDHLVAHTELDNAPGSWGTTWGGLANTQICALSEVQVYGSRILGMDGFQSGTACKQLSAFAKFRFNEIIGNKWWWLRSLTSASSACIAYNDGAANNYGLSDAGGVVGLILFY